MVSPKLARVWKSIRQFAWEFKEWLTEDDQTLSRIKNLRRQGIDEDNGMLQHLKKRWIREHNEDSGNSSRD